MAFYEVVLRSLYFGQQCINVFNYVTASGIGVTPNALELLTEMGFIPEGDPLAFPEDSIMALIQAVSNTSVEFLAVEARELYSLTDFYEAVYSPPINGTATSGDPASPFLSYGFYSARVRLDIRRAFKRFVGASEGYIGAGGVLTEGITPVLVDLAEAMSADLTGLTAVYQPAVISREKVVDPETGKVTYQLYADPAEQAEHVAAPLEYTYYTTIRSQVSRQYGRGQ